MSNYADYIKEREGSRTIEDEHGFLTFKILEDCVFIQDLYIRPESRRMLYASEYADHVTSLAKELGHDKIVTSVDLNALNANQSLKVIMAYGFKLYYLEANEIYLFKEI